MTEQDYLDKVSLLADDFEPPVPSDEDLIAERMDEELEKRERERAEINSVIVGPVVPDPLSGV